MKFENAKICEIVEVHTSETESSYHIIKDIISNDNDKKNKLLIVSGINYTLDGINVDKTAYPYITPVPKELAKEIYENTEREYFIQDTISLMHDTDTLTYEQAKCIYALLTIDGEE